MSVADWIILAFLVFSTVAAAFQGFFREAFRLAGLIVGYLAAAWQYHRLSGWFAPYLKSVWIGEIAGFLIIFFAILILAMAAFAPAARWLVGSEFAPYFLVGGRAAVWLAPSELRNRFYQGLDYLKKVHSAADGTQPQPAGLSK